MEQYLDFRLHIAQGSGPDFPLTLTPPDGPPVIGTMRLPFDPAALEIALLKIERAVDDSREMQQGTRDVEDVDVASVASFGERMFDALFTEELADAFRKSQERARAADKGLRIRLSIEPASLAYLPWEFLYDTSVGDFVCLSTQTPIVRYLDFGRPLTLLKVEPPLRMLAMISSPTDLPKLDVANEKARIMEATQFLQDRGLLQIDWLEKDSTYDALQKRLRRKDVDYHIIHFVGHGGFNRTGDEGMLAFEREDGSKHEVSSLDVGRLLADKKSLRLVVLNSCLGAKGSSTNALSRTATGLVRHGVPSVVAMQYKISDRAAIEFFRELYEAITNGLPIDAAVSEARKLVNVTVRKSVEWATPTLYTRTPDGVLFALDGPQPSDARMAGAFATPVRIGVPTPVPMGAPTSVAMGAPTSVAMGAPTQPNTRSVLGGIGNAAAGIAVGAAWMVGRVVKALRPTADDRATTMGRTEPQTSGDRPAARHATAAETVLLGVTAPRSCRPGGQFNAVLAAYVEAARVSAQAKLQRLGGAGAMPLMDIPPDQQSGWVVGAPVTVRVTASHADVEPAERSFDWNGRENLAAFTVRVHNDAPGGELDLCFHVALANVPIASIPLPVALAAPSANETPRVESIRTARSAFASYSSKDAQTVGYCLSSLTRWSPGLAIFQDCLDLNPNELFKPQLANQIASSDVFMLFWSRNASASTWVQWEYDKARQAKGLEAVIPMPLEDPKIAPPPPEFEDAHMRDRFMAARYGLAKIDEIAAGG